MSMHNVSTDRQVSYRDVGEGPLGGGGTLEKGRRANVLRFSGDVSAAEVAAERIVHTGDVNRKGMPKLVRVGGESLSPGMKTGVHPLGNPGHGPLTPEQGDKTKVAKEEDFHPDIHRNTLWFATDIPTLGQSAENLAATVSGGTGDAGLSGGLKMSSTFLLVTGGLTMGIATERVKKAQEIGDVAEEQLARISQVRAGAEMTTGVTLGTLRGLTIAGTYTAARSVTTASTIVGGMATGVGSVFYGLIALPYGINAIQRMNFSREFTSYLDLGYGMDFLLKQLKLNEVEREEALEIFPTVYDDVLHMVTEDLELTEEEYQRLTEEELEFIEEKAIEIVERLHAAHPTLSDEVTERHVKVRLAKELSRKMLVKEAEFVRNTGPETLKLVKEVLHGAPTKGAEEIMEVANAEIRHAMILDMFVIVTCVIGIIGFILAMVFTGGAPLIAALSVVVAANIMMFALDLYGLIQSIKDMKAAPKDRILLIVCAALSLAFTAAGAFIAGSTLARLLVILLGVLFAGCQVGILGWSWYNHDKAEKSS